MVPNALNNHNKAFPTNFRQLHTELSHFYDFNFINKIEVNYGDFTFDFQSEYFTLRKNNHIVKSEIKILRDKSKI